MPAKKSPAACLLGKVVTSLVILFAFQHVSAQFGSRNTRPAIPELFNSGSRSGLNAPQSCGYSPVKQLTSLTPTEYDTLRLYATYYSVRNGLSSTLMLNNKGAEPIQANPTFYSLAGTRLQIAPITVPAASYIEVDMRQLLLSAGDEFREGSVNISYQGGPLQLGAQVRLVDQQHGLIWAEQMVYTTKFLSSTLENVWWLPTENTDTRLVVSNTSSNTLTATIKVEGTSPAQTVPTQISLNPWETRVIDIMRDLVGGTTGNLLTKGGISISHTGTPGAILARMYAAKPSAGYSASINFVDPQTAVSSKWNGNGFRLRNLDGSPLGSVLVARNTSDQTAHLRGRIPFTRPNGEMDTVLIPAVSIGARSSKSVNLGSLIGSANVPAEVSVAGIELEYDSDPGTVITAVQSVSSDGQHVFQVPMMDPQNIPSSAGGFPWKADGDFHTFVYIKNETSITRKYIAYLMYDGGGYATGVKELRAGESAAIDFRELRDSQVPDPSGRLIPLDLTTGQIAWSVVGSENKVLTGRSEQISLSSGVASTYACYNPCGNTYHTGWVDPLTAEAEVGSEQQFVANEVDVNAYGQIMPSFIPSGVSWDSSDWNIASVDSFGMADALDTGSASIQATWEAPHWWLEGTGVCDYLPIIVVLDAPIEAKPLIRILRNGQVISGTGPTAPTTNVSVGEQVALTATVTGSGTQSNRQWTIPGTKVANYSVTFTDQSSPTNATVTPLTDVSQAGVQFYWVDGGEGRNVQYSVMVNNRVYSATAKFNVKRPTSSLSANTSVVTLGPATVGKNDVFGLYLGRPDDSPATIGMDFSASVTIPSGFSGNWFWVQVVNSSSRSKTPVTGARQVFSGSGLDSSFPYTPQANSTAQDDSPGLPLSSTGCDFTAVTVNDSYSMYLMYLPTVSGQSSISVPLRKLDWTFSGTGSRGDPCNSWTLVNDAPHTATSITGQETTSFPIWTTNILSFTFHNE